MKVQKLLLYLFALLLVTSFSSCKKDDDKGPSNRDLLTAGEWRGYAVFINGNEFTRELREHDEFPFDVSRYTFRFDKAGTYLHSYDGETDNGTWEFTNNEQSLLLDKSTRMQATIKISKLTDKEFHFIDSDEESRSEVEFRFNR